jgi:hypothetical protein
MDTNGHESEQALEKERGLQPASTPRLLATPKQPEGRVPVGIRVYSCSFVVDLGKKNAPDGQSEASASAVVRGR